MAVSRQAFAVVRIGIGVVAVVGLATSQSSAPQPPNPPASSQSTSQAAAAPQTEPSIRVSVNEVIVPVTVTDDKGRFISNLEERDFQVLDQGRPQKLEYFSRERSQPVVVGFLIDLSNSSRTQWKNFQTAAEEMIYTLLPGDPKYSGYLIGYGNQAELMVDTTSDPDPLVTRVRKLKPGGGAALYDAIYQACTSRALIKGEPVEPRRVLIIIGDGNDNASKKTLDEVVEIAQRNLVTVYGVSTMSYGFSNDADDNLVKLAIETGGRVEYPLQNVYKDVNGYLAIPSDEGNFQFKVGTGGYQSALTGSIFRAISNVAGEVTTQYILRYIPDIGNDAPRQYRNINVKVDLPDVRVRARKGYYPSAQ